MERKSIFVSLATLGPIGYLPAPGTFATASVLPLVYFFSVFEVHWQIYLSIIIISFVVGIKIIGNSLEHFRRRNPSQIVFDELIGTLIVFLFVPISFFTLVLGFFTFRILDIFKPFGIRKCELLYGPLSVVADDIFAGILSNIVLRIILNYL